EAWDGIWYRLIADHGYLLVAGRQSDPAFFPLYPLLLKVAAATGLPLGVAGIVLSNLLFLAALLVFDVFGRDVVGPSVARRATILLAVFDELRVLDGLPREPAPARIRGDGVARASAAVG